MLFPSYIFARDVWNALALSLFIGLCKARRVRDRGSLDVRIVPPVKRRSKPFPLYSADTRSSRGDRNGGELG